jgi:hypothetical protein
MAVIKKAKFHIGSQKERAILATAGWSGKGRDGLWPLAFGLWPLVFSLRPLLLVLAAKPGRPKAKDQRPTDFSGAYRGGLRGGDEYQTRAEHYAEIS